MVVVQGVEDIFEVFLEPQIKESVQSLYHCTQAAGAVEVLLKNTMRLCIALMAQCSEEIGRLTIWTPGFL
jgi:hypothetical protein